MAAPIITPRKKRRQNNVLIIAVLRNDNGKFSPVVNYNGISFAYIGQNYNENYGYYVPQRNLRGLGNTMVSSLR